MRDASVQCRDYRLLLADIPDESIDLVLTDPPYGIGYQNPYTTAPHAILPGDERSFSYSRLAEESHRVLKPDCAFFAFTGWSVYPDHFREVQAAGFLMKEPLIVQKRPAGATDLHGSFQPNADWLIFAHKGSFTFRETQLVRNKRAGTIPNRGRQPVPEFKRRFPACWFGEGFPFSSENSSYQRQHELPHPTIKGLELMEWILQLATDPGAIVLDPFVGSGTTALAALRTGRRFIAGDIHPPFCEMANHRLEKERKE